MIFGLFQRRDPNAAIVDSLYAALAEASRATALYRDLGVPDTVEGRFDSLTLHAVLVLRRLRTLPDPAGDLAQDLVNAIFRHFDAALRELGVGDITVPKKMKTMAAAFAGRAKAYEDSFADETVLREALLRNVYGGRRPAGNGLERLVAYVRASEQALAGAEVIADRRVVALPGIADDVTQLRAGHTVPGEAPLARPEQTGAGLGCVTGHGSRY